MFCTITVLFTFIPQYTNFKFIFSTFFVQSYIFLLEMIRKKYFRQKKIESGYSMTKSLHFSVKFESAHKYSN